MKKTKILVAAALLSVMGCGTAMAAPMQIQLPQAPSSPITLTSALNTAYSQGSRYAQAFLMNHSNEPLSVAKAKCESQMKNNAYNYALFAQQSLPSDMQSLAHPTLTQQNVFTSLENAFIKGQLAEIQGYNGTNLPA